MHTDWNDPAERETVVMQTKERGFARVEAVSNREDRIQCSSAETEGSWRPEQAVGILSPVSQHQVASWHTLCLMHA